MRRRQSHLIRFPTTASKSALITSNSKKPATSTPPQPSITPIVLVHSQTNIKEMAAVNSTVLSCNYALSGASETNWKLACAPSVAPVSSAAPKLPAIRAQQGQRVSVKEGKAAEGRRAALLGLAAAVFATAASQANASILDEYLEKSQANKELNDKKRLATINANFARAYTVQFGTCKFPENFTGCQDLAKQKNVPFLSDDLDVECEGKDKYKCGSNVFWKW